MTTPSIPVSFVSGIGVGVCAKARHAQINSGTIMNRMNSLDDQYPKLLQVCRQVSFSPVVILNEVKDLSQARRSRYVNCVIQGPTVRSLVSLGMTDRI